MENEKQTIIFDGEACGLGNPCSGYKHSDTITTSSLPSIFLTEASEPSNALPDFDCDSNAVDWEGGLKLFSEDLDCPECLEACVEKINYEKIEGSENHQNQTQQVNISGLLKEELAESDCYIHFKIENGSQTGTLYMKAKNGSLYLEEKTITLDNGSYKITANVKEDAE